MFISIVDCVSTLKELKNSSVYVNAAKIKKAGDKIMKSKNVFRKIMFIFIFMLLTSGMLSASASTDDYSVIKEPTIENPTFEVEGNPTYQWYEGKMSKITDINASPYILDDTNSEATYDGEWWTSAYNIGPEGTYLNLFFEIEIDVPFS
jgi:hypothetical protein